MDHRGFDNVCEVMNSTYGEFPGKAYVLGRKYDDGFNDEP